MTGVQTCALPISAAKKVFDRRRNALRVDEATRRHILDVFETHPLLHGAAKLEEALPHFIGGEFVDRAQAAVAQVVDVVDMGTRVAAHQIHQILNGIDEIFRPEHHFLFRHRKIELASHAEATHASQAGTVRG